MNKYHSQKRILKKLESQKQIKTSVLNKDLSNSKINYYGTHNIASESKYMPKPIYTDYQAIEDEKKKIHDLNISVKKL